MPTLMRVPRMKNRFLTPWLGLALLGVLSGCGGAVAKSDLPGTYVADYGSATETVTITGDGHYVQTVKVAATGRVAVAKGKWSFDPQDPYITFEDMMVVVDYAGKLAPDFDQQKGTVVLSVVRWLGNLQLGGDDIPPLRRAAGHAGQKRPE